MMLLDNNISSVKETDYYVKCEYTSDDNNTTLCPIWRHNFDNEFLNQRPEHTTTKYENREHDKYWINQIKIDGVVVVRVG